MTRIRIDVPATCSNIGPGLHTLALAIGLYSSIELAEIESGLQINIDGAGANDLPRTIRNLAARAAVEVFRKVGFGPSGLEIQLVNHIPDGCGLGGREAAVLGGLIGANDLLGGPLPREELLKMACSFELEFHTLLAALHGNLIIAARSASRPIFRQVAIAPITLCVVVPRLPGQRPVASLPAMVNLVDLLDHIGRTALIVQGLVDGDFDLLKNLLTGSLLETRLAEGIPGYQEAVEAAVGAGAAGVVISGSGPALVAFAPDNHDVIIAVMSEVLKNACHCIVDSWILPVETHGISISATGASLSNGRPKPVSAGGIPVDYTVWRK